MVSLVTGGQVAQIRQAFRNLEDTVEVTFWDVTWVAWSLDRPDAPGESWDDGTADETWYLVDSGIGRLSTNGAGGPVVGQDVIYQQAPYRLRFRIDTDLAALQRLVVGQRQFKVEHVEDRAGERQHGYAYLTEIFNADLPEVTP